MALIRRLHPVDEVVNSIVNALGPIWSRRIEQVRLNEALGRIAAREYRAILDTPSVDKSVLDGFAARSSDLEGASHAQPAILVLRGSVEVGSPPPPPLAPGECVRVSTGSALPPNADVVIPVEAVTVEGDYVYVYKPYHPGYGVMRRGEDLRKGEVIVSRGERISWYHIGLLASQGISHVEVYKLPSIAVFSVGDEVVEPGEHLEEGKVYNSTRPLIASYLRHRGFEVEELGHVGDNPSEIKAMFERGMERHDITLGIGGSSVGQRDYTARVLDDIVSRYGGWCIHGLLLRPGRTAKICVTGTRLLASLSGFPVAAWAQVYTVIERAVYTALGSRWPPDPPITARLKRRVASGAGVLDVIRVRVCEQGGELLAEPLRITGSGVLSTLLRGNAVLLVPEDVTGYDEGVIVTLYLLAAFVPKCGA